MEFIHFHPWLFTWIVIASIYAVKDVTIRMIDFIASENNNKRLYNLRTMGLIDDSGDD